MAKQIQKNKKPVEAPVVDPKVEEPVEQATLVEEVVNVEPNIEPNNEVLDHVGEEEDVEEAPQEQLYPVVLNHKLDSYIGDAWYHLDSGIEYYVPKNVRDILLGAGYLVAR